ncbi:MAG: hypothetical protein ACKPKO_08710, partial [Candidatus Fonsibacter sp.]
IYSHMSGINITWYTCESDSFEEFREELCDMFGTKRTEFWLTCQGRLIEPTKRARDYAHGTWVSINFRCHGGGKRGSSGASKRAAEDEKTKDEIIDELKRAIDITLKQIGSPKSIEFQQALGHIKKLAIEVERNPDSLFEILQMLDRVKFDEVQCRQWYQ